MKKLSDFRAELVELAFTMDRRGRLEAADVAMTASARVGELCEELSAAGWPRPSTAAGTDPQK
jgi:hypothetical protein